MLTEDIKQMLSTTIKKLTGKVPESIHLEPSDNPDHGDFSTNSALTTSKQLKNKAPLVRGGANESEQGVFSSPREVAEELIAALPENDLISKTDIAGPGFINFWLSDKAYREAFSWLNNKIDQNSFGVLDIGKAQTAITDTSHPNVAKPMGVHHLLSTIIGQSINNLLKTCGYTLIKDNYLGDWGTQFGKLTYAIKTWGHMEVIKSDPIPELLKLYVKFHEEAEQNPTLEDQGRMEFKRLEEGNPESRKLLQWIVDLSLTEFQNIYDRLGVDFDLMNGESFYEDKMESIIKEGVRKGIIVEGEKGALIIPMNDPNKPPAIIRKKDGATLYATRDLARIKYWQDELKGDLGINVVDIAQKLYFEQLFESAQKMGFTKMKQVHIDFGRMEFPEGGMSTRKGKVVLLEEVLDEAERRAYEKIESHDSELSEQGKHELARIMGIGAIKYNVLSQNRNKNYTFDWNQMLSFEGNSAPYLQYAYTRTQSILKKVAEDQNPRLDDPQLRVYEPEEKQLIKTIISFEDIIKRSLENYKPNLLCTYLFELAQSFSQFYNNLRILDAESEEEILTRLQLVKDTAYVLKKGLEILGVEVPERM